MLNRHSKLKESGCPPSVGRLFAYFPDTFEIETRDHHYCQRKLGGGTLAISLHGNEVHPAMQMWMRVTAVCQKNQAMADPTRTSRFHLTETSGVVQKQPILGNKSSRNLAKG